MDIGEWLTRATVWVALSLYGASELVLAARRAPARDDWTRWLSTLGFGMFVIHILCAFHFFHDWSQTAAYTETARQTEQLVGWNWGGGLYVNYLFGAVWLAEVVWFWARPNQYRSRPKWVLWSVRVFFLFMIFNGTVVFGRWAARWFGGVLCVLLVLSWGPKARRAPGEGTGPTTA